MANKMDAEENDIVEVVTEVEYYIGGPKTRGGEAKAVG
jgi:hypothetical protein